MTPLEEIKKQVIEGEISLVTEEIEKDHINSEFAKNLFLFLYDYTNSFKNANTTNEILVLAGKTLEFGISHDKLIVEKIKKTYSQMKLCSDVIENVKLYQSGKIAGTYITRQMSEKYGNADCITDSFINNILVTVTGIDLCFVLVEIEKDTYELVLSKVRKDVDLEKFKADIGATSVGIIKGMNIEEILNEIETVEI